MSTSSAIVSDVEVRRSSSGDVVLHSGAWVVSFVRKPWAPGDPGEPGSLVDQWALAARNGKGPMTFGPTGGGFLDHVPTEGELVAYLRELQAAERSSPQRVATKARRNPGRKSKKSRR